MKSISSKTAIYLLSFSVGLSVHSRHFFCPSLFLCRFSPFFTFSSPMHAMLCSGLDAYRKMMPFLNGPLKASLIFS